MITIKQLMFSWTDRPPWVLDQLDFKIEKGDYISIVGDNGCGKTTLMRLMLGFLTPSAGTLEVSTDAIGYVAQQPENENRGFPITVEELLGTHRRIRRLSPTRVETVLDQVQLKTSQKKRVGDLSGGQRQRLSIALALLTEPELLLLDEPSTGIDARSQKDIYQLINDLNREAGITVVSIEHNLDAAITNSTRIYHLKDGHGHFCSPEQFTRELKLRRAM